MQKLYFGSLFACLVLSLTFLSSCKKDSASSSEKITGKWNMLYTKYHFVSQGMDIRGTDTIANSTVQFNANGTFVDVSDSETVSGSWQISGNKLVRQEDDISTKDTFDIQKLTSTELELYQKQTEGADMAEATFILHK